MQTCIACGMPMKNAADHALGDESKAYCIYCARPDGTMQSYEEKLDGLTNFVVRTQGLDATAARSTARAMMAQLPAWKDRAA